MRMEEGSGGEYRGFSVTQMVVIVIILGLLSVVAVPRFVDMRRDRQREAGEEAAHGYIRALHGVLTVQVANHYLRGAKWVEDGEELMEGLGQGWKMPRGMHYADNVWTDQKTGLQWQFHKASDRLPPRIRRVQQRVPPETWEMEPIRQVRHTQDPKF